MPSAGWGDADRPQEGAPHGFQQHPHRLEDPTRLVEYYTKVLGEPAFSDSGYTGWRLGTGIVSVGPHSEVKGRNPSPGRIIWNIVTSDVQGEFDRMKAAGGIVVAEPYTFEQAPGSLIATLEDPDGNYFRFQTPFEM